MSRPVILPQTILAPQALDHVLKQPCPQCGDQDAERLLIVPNVPRATPVRNHQPRPDDFLVCGDCFRLCRFDADMALQAFADEDFSLLPLDQRTQLKEAITVLHMMCSDRDDRVRQLACSLAQYLRQGWRDRLEQGDDV